MAFIPEFLWNLFFWIMINLCKTYRLCSGWRCWTRSHMNPQEVGSSRGSSSNSKSFRQHEWRHQPPLLSSATLYCTASGKDATLHHRKDIEDTSKQMWFLHPCRCQTGFWVLASNGLKWWNWSSTRRTELYNRDRQLSCCRTVYIVVPSPKILYTTKKPYCNYGTSTVTLWSCNIVYSYLALIQIRYDLFFHQRQLLELLEFLWNLCRNWKKMFL
jgi:hypothetical protein